MLNNSRNGLYRNRKLRCLVS